MTKHPIASIIIIVNDGQVDLLKKHLDSVRSNRVVSYFETIVVDNGTTDSTSSYLKSMVKRGVKTVSSDTILSYSDACNLGAKIARGEFFFFLSVDTEPECGWLDYLILGMFRCSAKICGPRLTWNDPLTEKNVRKISSSAIMIYKKVYNELYGFDADIKNADESCTDLCFRAIALGYECRIFPLSLVNLGGRVAGVDYSSDYDRTLASLREQSKVIVAVEAPPVKPIDINQYECPMCHHITSYLPSNLDMVCPNCRITPARKFIQVGSLLGNLR